MRDQSSQLHWTKRMLEVRKQHPVFGTGTLEVVHSENPSVLAYVRAMPADSPDIDAVDPQGVAHSTRPVLCVCNLSRFAQPAELPLQRWMAKSQSSCSAGELPRHW